MVSNWKHIEKCINLSIELEDHKKNISSQLIDACQNNEKTLVKMLIKQGCTPNSNDGITTPLMACVDSNQFEMAQFILSLGGNPSFSLNDNDAIWLSLRQNKHNFLNLFYNKQLKTNREKATGKSLLMYATENSDVNAVEILANNKTVLERDILGNTALHYNLSKKEPTQNDVQIGRILLSAGADINSRNHEGQTAEQCAGNEITHIIAETATLENAIPEPKEEQKQDNNYAKRRKPKFKI